MRTGPITSILMLATFCLPNAVEARPFTQKSFYWLDGRLPRADERLVVSTVSHLDDVAGPCDTGSTQINEPKSIEFGQKVFAVKCGRYGYERWHLFGYGWFWTSGGRLTYTR